MQRYFDYKKGDKQVITFIVLHYKTEKDTIICVESIKKLHGEKNILILDNGSNDESGLRLKNRYQEEKNIYVQILINGVGFSQGNNIAFSKSKEIFPQFDFIVCINNDTEINDYYFIDKIYSIYDKKRFYILGPDIYCPRTFAHQNPMRKTIRGIDEIDDIIDQCNYIINKKIFLKEYFTNWFLNSSLYYYYVRLFRPYLKKSLYSMDKSQPMDYPLLHGACLIFSKLYICQNFKLFMPETRFYAEEDLLCYRCKKNDWRICYDPGLSIIHYDGKATKATYNSIEVYYKNKFKLMKESFTIYKKYLEGIEINE